MRFPAFFLLILIISSCSDSELVNLNQLSKGAQLYKTHCANCHQEDGSGLAKLIPPLKASDYLQEKAAELPCMILRGKSGEMSVNGIKYNLKMPPVKGLSNAEIIDICAFVLQKFPDNPVHLGDTVFLSQIFDCEARK